MYRMFVKTASFHLFYVAVGLLSAIATSSVHAQSTSIPKHSSLSTHSEKAILRLKNRDRYAVTVKEWLAQIEGMEKGSE